MITFPWLFVGAIRALGATHSAALAYNVASDPPVSIGYPTTCCSGLPLSYVCSSEIMWFCHHVELLGASSDTSHTTFGKSFSVSTTFFTYASCTFVIAFGPLIVIELVPPPSSIPFTLFAPVNGYPSVEQRLLISPNPSNSCTAA